MLLTIMKQEQAGLLCEQWWPSQEAQAQIISTMSLVSEQDKLFDNSSVHSAFVINYESIVLWTEVTFDTTA